MFEKEDKDMERRYQPFIRESFYVTGTPAHQRKVIPKRQADGSDINSAKETQESIRWLAECIIIMVFPFQ